MIEQFQVGNSLLTVCIGKQKSLVQQVALAQQVVHHQHHRIVVTIFCIFLETPVVRCKIVLLLALRCRLA